MKVICTVLKNSGVRIVNYFKVNLNVISKSFIEALTVKQSAISFIYRRKRSGPRILPCGIPLVTLIVF